MQLAKSPPFSLRVFPFLFLSLYFPVSPEEKVHPNWKSLLRRPANLFLSLSLFVPFQCKSRRQSFSLPSVVEFDVPSLSSPLPCLTARISIPLICLAVGLWLSGKRNSAISRAVKRANRWPSHVSKQGVNRYGWPTPLTDGWIINFFSGAWKKSAGN